MAEPFVPGELWAVLEPMIPKHKPSPKCGRSQIADGYSVCSEEWHSVGDVASGNGLWVRDVVLTSLAGMATGKCLGQVASYAAESTSRG